MKLSVFQLVVVLFIAVTIAVASTVGVMLAVNRPSGDGMVVVYESTTPSPAPAPNPTTPSLPQNSENEAIAYPWETDEWADIAFDADVIYEKAETYRQIQGGATEFLTTFTKMLDDFAYRFDMQNAEDPYCYSEAMLPLVIEFYQELTAFKIAAESLDGDYATVVYYLYNPIWHDAAAVTVFGEACGLYLQHWVEVVHCYVRAYNG